MQISAALSRGGLYALVSTVVSRVILLETTMLRAILVVLVQAGETPPRNEPRSRNQSRCMSVQPIYNNIVYAFVHYIIL
jgi:hypothetical protein